MERFILPLTSREYRSNLCYIRKVIALDRRSTLSLINVVNEFGHGINLYLNQENLYIVGLDFGSGPYRFRDHQTPAIPNSKIFEFGGRYAELGLEERTELELSAPLLASAVTELAYHRPNGNGSGLFVRRKQALVRIIFAVSEALRFWTIQRDVENLLANPTTSLLINSYAGDQKPLNSWASWSKQLNWPDKGIFVPAKHDS